MHWDHEPRRLVGRGSRGLRKSITCAAESSLDESTCRAASAPSVIVTLRSLPRTIIRTEPSNGSWAVALKAPSINASARKNFRKLVGKFKSTTENWLQRLGGLSSFFGVIVFQFPN